MYQSCNSRSHLGIRLVSLFCQLKIVKDKTIISLFIRLEKTVTKMATCCFRMVKMDIFAVETKGLFLVSNEKMEKMVYLSMNISIDTSPLRHQTLSIYKLL